MKNRNCPNCGAPIDIEKNKCAYCGTSYYDLTLMPLQEPFFLRINVGTEENPKIVFAKVICENFTINQSRGSLAGYYDNTQVFIPVRQGLDTSIEMNFYALSGLTYTES